MDKEFVGLLYIYYITILYGVLDEETALWDTYDINWSCFDVQNHHSSRGRRVAFCFFIGCGFGFFF